MAIAHRNTSFATGSAQNPLGTDPSGAISGDLLVALVIHELSSSAITGPSGWTQLFEGGSPSTGGSGFRYWLGWQIRSGTPTLTWTTSSGGTPYYESHITALSGSFDSGSIDASASGTTAATGTSPDPPSATCAASAALAYAAAVQWAGSGGGGWTAPSGYTLRSNNSAGNDGMVATKAVSLTTGNTENPAAFTGGGGNADLWNGATLLIKETGGGGGGGTPPATQILIVPSTAVVGSFY